MSASELAPVYGPIYTSLFFSTIVSTALYGVTCMQTFFYYVHYHNDPVCMRIFVAAIWAFNTIHESLIVAGEYKYIMAGLENPSALLNGEPELVLLITAIIAVTTQGFFIYRIYVFNGKNVFGPLIWVPLAIFQLGSTSVYVGKALYIADGVHAVELVAFLDHFFAGIATSSLAVAAGVDVLIAAFLTILLVRKRIAAGYASTAHILQRLMLFTVNAGIWTAAFALLSLILLHLYPTTFLHAVFSFPLCSIYCNTLLANLNGRAYIRGKTTTQNPDGNFFMSSTLPMPDSVTNGDTRPQVISFRTSVMKSEGHGGMAFLPVVADRPMTPTSENACV
ncbi:hypothetical protein OG21DRAFT_1107858 [Imleria badia]|nr:hypothetical protein OG21DRAFT_1107858 [Imleria badia]